MTFYLEYTVPLLLGIGGWYLRGLILEVKRLRENELAHIQQDLTELRQQVTQHLVWHSEQR